jgi:hypothetical protein
MHSSCICWRVRRSFGVVVVGDGDLTRRRLVGVYSEVWRDKATLQVG